MIKQRKKNKLGAVRPRFTSNLTGKHKSCFELSINSHACCPFVSNQVSWHKAALPYFARHPLGKAIKRSGWTIAGQSICPILVWGTPYLVFVFLVNLYKQTFTRIFCPIFRYFLNVPLYFIRMFGPPIQTNV